MYRNLYLQYFVPCFSAMNPCFLLMFLPQSLPAIKPNKTFIEVYFVVFSRIQIKIFANTRGGGEVGGMSAVSGLFGFLINVDLLPLLATEF